MYKGGKPPVNYPDPTKLRWARPVYKSTSSKKKPKGDDDDDDDDDEEDEDEDDDEGWDDEFNDTSYEDDESWCSEAELFKDGMSAGDVKQGKLGDCWFLGAGRLQYPFGHWLVEAYDDASVVMRKRHESGKNVLRGD